MIDVEGVSKRLRLPKKAKEQGSANIPAADSQSPDAVERSVISEIEIEGQTQFSDYLERQKAYASRFADAALEGLKGRVSAAADVAISNLNRCIRDGQNKLHVLERDLRGSEGALAKFKESHHLERAVLDQGAMTFKIGVLIFILALEALLNGYFLAKGNVLGFLGGVSDALLIATVNIVFGVVAGRALVPYLWHVRKAPRIAASVGLLAYLASVLAFNLAVAHYRNAVGGPNPFEASTIAYQTLMVSPLGIEDMQSWALFFLGTCFSFIAAYDGLRMDDPYPGFGRVVRRNLDAVENYTTAAAELRDELDEVKATAEAEMNHAMLSVEGRQAEALNLASSSESLNLAMAEHFAHLETSANTLLRIYRDENVKHRKVPAPKHFETTWKYPTPALVAALKVDRVALAAAVNDALKEIASKRSRLHSSYDEAMKKYKSIADIVQEVSP